MVSYTSIEWIWVLNFQLDLPPTTYKEGGSIELEDIGRNTIILITEIVL